MQRMCWSSFRFEPSDAEGGTGGKASGGSGAERIPEGEDGALQASGTKNKKNDTGRPQAGESVEQAFEKTMTENKFEVLTA